MTTHVDGDDYTWQAGPVQARAVLKPSAAAFAELRAQFGAEFDRAFPAGWEGLAARDQAAASGAVGRYSLLDEMTELEPVRLGGTQPAMRPDLRTADQVERDDTAQLALRCDNLVDALAAMGGRVAALERTVAALVKVLEVRL